jgi:hypothetical protein
VAWATLVAVCLGSRLATTITYIEDPDSLRFALSVAEGFDVAALQPHFPGYPVFWALARMLSLAVGRFSVAFSLVGGLATVGIAWALLRLWRVRLQTAEGATLAGLVAFNPLVWLMSTRYMPDLLGTAAVLAALVVLERALGGEATAARRLRPRLPGGLSLAAAGGGLAGLLAGLRLSYVPMLLPAGLLVLWRSPRRLAAMAAGLGGTAAWLVPMTVDTGLWTLVDVARAQTVGHFTEFGGTVQTAPDLGRRLAGTVEGLWADGLGAWWPGRHPLTAVVGAGLAAAGAIGTVRLWRGATPAGRRRAALVLACASAYGLWMFFFQNVVHKSRHVLPLLPLLLVAVAAGAVALGRHSRPGRLAAALTGAAYAAVGLVLAVQHLQPTAIAQAKTYVDRRAANGPVRVVSDPLVNTYLQKQAVDARYVSVDDSAAVRRVRRSLDASAGPASETGSLDEAGGDGPAASARRTTLVIGTYASLLSAQPDTARTFYHNPYVNRMWPEVTVYVYEH